MITWLGTPASSVGQFRLRAPGSTQRRSPALREPPSRYSFSLVRVLPDCRELVAWSEGPLTLTRAQADARWVQIIPRVTGVGGHPGEGLELRMLRGSVVVNTRVFVGRPAACAGSIGWLGQAGCVTPPCPAGTIKLYDSTCLSGYVKCGPGTNDGCPADMALSPKSNRCVPITCPSGTARNERDECQVAGQSAPIDYCVLPSLPPAVPAQIATRFEVCWNGQCTSGELSILLGNLTSIAGQYTSTQPAVAAQIQRAHDALVAGGASRCPTPPPTGLPPPAPGECWDAQEVVGAQPCFYFNEAGNYVGPPELLRGNDIAALRSFCLQMYFAGYFDMPLCDAPATIQAPPTCLSPEERGVVKYCREKGWTGDNRTANYFCWAALKAPAELAEWEATPDCQPDAPPLPPPVEIPSGEPSVPGAAPAAPIAKKSSAAVPLLIGAAVVGAAVYFLS